MAEEPNLIGCCWPSVAPPHLGPHRKPQAEKLGPDGYCSGALCSRIPRWMSFERHFHFWKYGNPSKSCYLLKHQTVRGSVPRNAGIWAANLSVHTSHFLHLCSYGVGLPCHVKRKIPLRLFHFTQMIFCNVQTSAGLQGCKLFSDSCSWFSSGCLHLVHRLTWELQWQRMKK